MHELDGQIAEKVKDRRERFLKAGFKEEHVDVLSLAYIDGMKEGVRISTNMALVYSQKETIERLRLLSLSVTKCGNALHSVMKSQDEMNRPGKEL